MLVQWLIVFLGITFVFRCLQEVHIDKHIKILDCPGIVMTSSSDAAMILRNCVKIEQLVNPVPAVETILQRCNKKQVGYSDFILIRILILYWNSSIILGSEIKLFLYYHDLLCLINKTLQTPSWNASCKLMHTTYLSINTIVSLITFNNSHSKSTLTKRDYKTKICVHSISLKFSFNPL